jgi:hypothetical protein
MDRVQKPNNSKPFLHCRCRETILHTTILKKSGRILVSRHSKTVSCSSKELQRAAPAELQLMLSVLEVNVVDGMSDVPAPITSLVTFEVSATALREAHLGTERLLASWRLQGEQLLVAGHLLAPGAHRAARGDTRHICGHTPVSSWHTSVLTLQQQGTQ